MRPVAGGGAGSGARQRVGTASPGGGCGVGGNRPQVTRSAETATAHKGGSTSGVACRRCPGPTCYKGEADEDAGERADASPDVLVLARGCRLLAHEMRRGPAHGTRPQSSIEGSAGRGRKAGCPCMARRPPDGAAHLQGSVRDPSRCMTIPGCLPGRRRRQCSCVGGGDVAGSLCCLRLAVLQMLRTLVQAVGLRMGVSGSC